VEQEEGELVVIQVAARVDALYEFCQGYTKPLEQLLALVDNQLLLHKVKVLGVEVEEEEEEEFVDLQQYHQKQQGQQQQQQPHQQQLKQQGVAQRGGGVQLQDGCGLEDQEPGRDGAGKRSQGTADSSQVRDAAIIRLC
jgi:hypothetical protein